MINCQQLRDLVITPTLMNIGLYSPDAVQLLLMTAATESNLGEFIRQQNVAPTVGAYGIYQMESLPYNSLYDNLITTNLARLSKVKLYLGYAVKPQITRLITDLALATLMARLYYLNIQDPIPTKDNVEAMANYYKRYWNTKLGAANVVDVVQSYNKLVLGK